MKLESLSKEDQELLATDFPAEIEKQAAADVAKAQELYDAGFSKLAEESAKEMDEAKEKEKEKPEHKLDDGEKKEAAARGAFIARGFIDGLQKIGSEKHQDPMHYFIPMVTEKLAAQGIEVTEEKVAGAMEKLKAGGAWAKGHLSSMGGKAKELGAKAKAHAGSAADKAKAGAHKAQEHMKAHKGAYMAGAGGAAAGAGAGFMAGRSSKKD